MFNNDGKTARQISNLAVRGLRAWHTYGFRIFLRKLFFKTRKRIASGAGRSVPLAKLIKRDNKLITAKPDVICFSVIDWDFRFQRPQHILQQFARDGHAVYYINTRFYDDRHCQIQFRTVEENIKTLSLPGDRMLDIYRDPVGLETFRSALTALSDFVTAQQIVEAICLVHHPFWTPIALTFKDRYGWKIVYDCMDFHSKFSNVSKQIPDLENDLVLKSDLVITTSRSLYNSLSPKNANCVSIPNAGDYAHFSQMIPCEKSRLANVLHPIIGFFGAIAEWIDLELLSQTAIEHPNWSFVLIGEISGGQIRRIEKLSNVHFLGEKSYSELPNYLAAFDVCIIPFQRTLLTEAMNPVKVFEYLGAGKPIVARRLPELESLADVVYLYDTPNEFSALLEQAILEDSAVRKEKRQAVARQNTWEMRYQSIKIAIESQYDQASIIIVTWNNLEFTQMCIQSILADQTWPNYEIIFIDNASKDGTVEYLRLLAEQLPHVKVFFNNENLGFAAANNIGLKNIQGGKFVILLNNDTIVPRGWLARLLRHARQPDVGLVGPVTNFAGNEARIEVPYIDISNMENFALAHSAKHDGMTFDIKMLAMYCVAMRKDVFEQIGPLDERFGIGMFEDDDYSKRVRQAGYRIICAEDVYVHHYGRASIDKLSEYDYWNLFEKNRRLYEDKWKEAWVPHKYRGE